MRYNREHRHGVGTPDHADGAALKNPENVMRLCGTERVKSVMFPARGTLGTLGTLGSTAPR